nr:hypothetical protein [Tanacetum cinerariifolium]
KEKLLELANTPLNENCSAVILKKLPEKLGDRGKFLIPCGFSELKCKAQANLVNQAICTPAGIARDVFVSVGKFTFPADFVIVDYESDPRVPFILGRPFLRTTRALIDVLGEEMILHDGEKKTRKGQNRIKIGQKREAWRSREKFKAVAVDKGRKTEENAKRMVENAYT